MDLELRWLAQLHRRWSQFFFVSEASNVQRRLQVFTRKVWSRSKIGISFRTQNVLRSSHVAHKGDVADRARQSLRRSVQNRGIVDFGESWKVRIRAILRFCLAYEIAIEWVNDIRMQTNADCRSKDFQACYLYLV